MFLTKICGNFISKCIPLISTNVVPPMAIHTSSVLAGEVGRFRSYKDMRKTTVKKSDGIDNANTVDIEAKKLVSFFPVNLYLLYFVIILLHSFIFSSENFQRFPDVNLPNKLFNNIPFKDLPIISITVTKNNTKVICNDVNANTIAFSSCGKNGFKNCRKGTNVAGQATAIVVAKVS